MTSNFHINQAFLAREWPVLAKKLEKTLVNLPLNLEKTRSDHLTLVIEGSAIHSRYNPLQEAHKEFVTIPLKADIIILAGIGLGYLALEIIKQRPHVKLIIIEPNLSFLLIAQKTLDLRELYSHPHLTIITQEDPLFLQQTLLTWQAEDPHWHELRARVDLERKIFTPYKKVYQEYLQRIKTNQLALQQYALLWWRNSIKNLHYWQQAKAVHTLFNQCKDLPILIIGAGPSLTYHQKDLPLLAQRMVIICVDTALRILLAQKIRPDLIISIDSQYWNARHLDHLHIAEIPYIVDSAVHPMLIKNINVKDLYMMSPIVPLMQPMERELSPFGTLRSGGSVSITAWDLALQMKPPSIWLLGVDLGYPQQATHAKGALFEEWMLAHSNRFETLHHHHIQLHHPNSITLSNNHNAPIASDARMHLYLRWMEEALTKEEIPSYNLSTLGVKIKGMPYRTIESALTLPVLRKNIDKKFHQLRSINSQYNVEKKEKLVLLTKESHKLLLSFTNRLINCTIDKLNTLQDDPAITYFQPILSFWLNQVIKSPTIETQKRSLILRLKRLIELYTLNDVSF